MFFTKWVHLPISWSLIPPLKSNVFKINKLAYNLFILLSLNKELTVEFKEYKLNISAPLKEN